MTSEAKLSDLRKSAVDLFITKEQLMSQASEINSQIQNVVKQLSAVVSELKELEVSIESQPKEGA